mmetsp:Transcript_11441/g.25939  ORF Transcript_11441/g.25939 Transcript_11441/m.25939 type:complete len:97 (-) Transcript_11441:77-367(-)
MVTIAVYGVGRPLGSAPEIRLTVDPEDSVASMCSAISRRVGCAASQVHIRGNGREIKATEAIAVLGPFSESTPRRIFAEFKCHGGPGIPRLLPSAT